MNIPWVDKYRPKKIQDVIYQDHITNVLNQTILSGQMPHLLLHGPPGTGKTSTILALSYQLFGPKKFNERVMELNASDERGINVVRNKIYSFARTAIGSKDHEYPCPPFKIIILDEADAMTMEAQSALRKVMEELSHITRFCFICNYKNQIIDPIVSRCMKFRFKPINHDYMFKKLQEIAINEKLELSPECIRKITSVSKGDFRQSISLLQNLKYIIPINNSILPEDIDMFAGVNPTNVSSVKDIFNDCVGNKISPNVLRQKLEIIKKSCTPIGIVIETVSNLLIESSDIDDKKKSLIMLHLSNVEKCVFDGANEYVQLLSIFSHVRSVICNNKNCVTSNIC